MASGPQYCDECEGPTSSRNPVDRYVEKDVSEEDALFEKNGVSYGRTLFLHGECKRRIPANLVPFSDIKSSKRPSFTT